MKIKWVKWDVRLNLFWFMKTSFRLHLRQAGPSARTSCCTALLAKAPATRQKVRKRTFMMSVCGFVAFAEVILLGEENSR